MTGAQADWLRSNPPYRAIAVAPSGHQYVKRGMLHADGSFDLHVGGRNRVVKQGSIEVGVLEPKQQLRR